MKLLHITMVIKYSVILQIALLAHQANRALRQFPFLKTINKNPVKNISKHLGVIHKQCERIFGHIYKYFFYICLF